MQQFFDRKPSFNRFLNTAKKKMKKGLYPLEQVSCQDGNIDRYYVGVLQSHGDKIQTVTALAYTDTAFNLVSFA